MAAAVRGPAMAVAVVALETQRLRVAAMQVAESAARDGFSARASVDRDGVRVEGEAGYGSSKKAARQAAALSLLAALTGLAIPEGARLGTRPVVPTAPEVTAAELESWLDYEVGRPAPDPECSGVVRSGRLSARSVCLLLFDADPNGWAEARAAAWEALVGTPSMAGGVLPCTARPGRCPRQATSRRERLGGRLPAGGGRTGRRRALPRGRVQGREGSRGPGVAQGSRAVSRPGRGGRAGWGGS